jgi:hypothetical protein
LLEKFEAQIPKSIKYVVKRKVMQHLEEHSDQAILDKEASSLWSMKVLILAQDEFDNAYTKKNGPGKLPIVPHIFSSLIELYGQHKRVPSLLKKHKVVRAVSDICFRCNKDADVMIALQKMTQTFLQRARAPEPSPPQTPSIFLAFSPDVSPSFRSVLRGVSPDSGPGMDPGLKEALQAMEEIGQASTVGPPTSSRLRYPVSSDEASSPKVSLRGPGIPFVTGTPADSGRNKMASPAATLSDEITPQSKGRNNDHIQATR